MSAAVEASLAGARVIVLEKHSATGGDSSICSGNFYCCGSKKQDDMGYTNYGTPEEVAQFFYDQSDGDANMDICRLVAENGGEAMDWLVGLRLRLRQEAGRQRVRPLHAVHHGRQGHRGHPDSQGRGKTASS